MKLRCQDGKYRTPEELDSPLRRAILLAVEEFQFAELQRLMVSNEWLRSVVVARTAVASA